MGSRVAVPATQKARMRWGAAVARPPQVAEQLTCHDFPRRHAVCGECHAAAGAQQWARTLDACLNVMRVHGAAADGEYVFDPPDDEEAVTTAGGREG